MYQVLKPLAGIQWSIMMLDFPIMTGKENRNNIVDKAAFASTSNCTQPNKALLPCKQWKLCWLTVSCTHLHQGNHCPHYSMVKSWNSSGCSDTPEGWMFSLGLLPHFSHWNRLKLLPVLGTEMRMKEILAQLSASGDMIAWQASRLMATVIQMNAFFTRLFFIHLMVYKEPQWGSKWFPS